MTLNILGNPIYGAFPERFRAFIAAAHAYLDGDGRATIATLNGHAQIAREICADPQIRALLDEWLDKIDARWNEWGMHPEPIDEDTFRAWMSDSLGRGDSAGRSA